MIAFGKYLNEPDSSYARIRHGVYQKIPVSLLQDQQMNNQLILLHRFLDQTVALQEQMANAYQEGTKDWPDAQEQFHAIWKSADNKVDELIDSLSVWIAETEDFDMTTQNIQQAPQGMQL